MRSLCVFCGSSPGFDHRYRRVTRSLGRTLAVREITIVYGGASVGLMGALADAALEAGGEVIGVIPEALVQKEVAHRRLTELRIVTSMHERKATMAALSDAFVALPGGIGTLEELFEVWTWAQLGHHTKACGIMNVAGFYDYLIPFLDQLVTSGFMKQAHRDMLIVSDSVDSLLANLRSFERPAVSKWITSDQS